MAPYPRKPSDDDDTVDTDTESIPTTKPKKKKRNLTKISNKYDLDGDGILDEAEQAMRDHDTEDRGFLTNDEIYSIVKEQLRAQRRAGHMKRLIVALIAFVVLLALANLGTSLASAILAKDMVADGADGAEVRGADGVVSKAMPKMMIKATGDIAAVQSVADTYEAAEMSGEELDERRRLVMAEMEEDPHSHAHRHLKKKGRKSISLDFQKMSDGDLLMIEQKCQKNQNVNIKRKYKDGGNSNSKNQCVCQLGTSVVVKEKRKKGKNKGKNKGKKGRAREVIIESPNGRIMHGDCDGDVCYIGGDLFQGDEGDDCLIQASECQSDLVCTSRTIGKNLRVTSRYGTCKVPTVGMTDVVVVRLARQGDFCNPNSGWEACDTDYYCDETKRNSNVGICTRTVGLGQSCSNDFMCGVDRDGNNISCDRVCMKFLSPRCGGRNRPTPTPTIRMKAREDEECDVTYGRNACYRDFVCTGRDGVIIGRVGTGHCRRPAVTTVIITRRAPNGAVCSVDFASSACVSRHVCLSRNGLTLSSGFTGFCQSGSYNQIYRINIDERANDRSAGAGEQCFINNGSDACVENNVCLGSNEKVLRSGQAGWCQYGTYRHFYGNGNDGSISVNSGSIRERSSRGNACWADYGANSCSNGLVCLSNNGNEVVVTSGRNTSGRNGICHRGSWDDWYGDGTTIIVRSGGSRNDQCSWDNGQDACANGYVCLGRNDQLLGRGSTGWCTSGSWNDFYGRSGGDCPRNRGGDCSNARCCAGRLECMKGPLNGSDRWYCE